MARPQRPRKVCAPPEYARFITPGSSPGNEIELCLDEYEALRLIDYNGLTHEDCANRMQVSRTTATEIYASARRKVADAIVTGRGLVIEGGNINVCTLDENCGNPMCPRHLEPYSEEQNDKTDITV
jgi:predicted DNA-binding protein (UPF0251 family)